MREIDLKSRECIRCGGTGREEDPDVMWYALRSLKSELGWGHRRIAAEAECSKGYISQVFDGSVVARGPAVRRMYTVMYDALQQTCVNNAD